MVDSGQDSDMSTTTATTQSEIARALGLSRQAVSRNKQQGMPVDSVDAAQAWREGRQNVAARKPLPTYSPPDDFDPFGEDRDAARTRRERAEADISEMTAAKLRRELISVDAVQRQLAVDFATTRDALLQIPARLGPVLAAHSDAAEVQRLLHDEIHQALVDLSGAADQIAKIEGAFD
jgi:transcriptional regulator with XRE-family HTH domain